MNRPRLDGLILACMAQDQATILAELADLGAKVEQGSLPCPVAVRAGALPAILKRHPESYWIEVES